MKRIHIGGYRIVCASLLVFLAAVSIRPQTLATGGLKGKVRVESGSAAAGVVVTVRKGEKEISHVSTDRKGNFQIEGLEPGTYNLTFRRKGLSVGTLDNVDVNAGKVRDLPDRLILKTDEGSLAFLRGSVFDQAGKSIAGARVDLARIEASGKLKKIEGRVTNEIGAFAFRLPPAAARYKITVNSSGSESATKEMEVDGPAIYRIAFSLRPAAR